MIDYKEKLATVFDYSSFSDEERQRRSILIILVGLTSFAGLIYSVIYVFLGVSQAMIAIQIYIGFSLINLALYYFYKNYNLFRNVQLLAILLFPTLTHILIGGFEQSSVVVLSAMMSPLGALMFHTPKRAKVFFMLFVLMVFLSVIVDLFIPIARIDIPKDIRIVFYFLNIVIITSISFFLLLKFVSDNEEFKKELKSKNLELLEEKQRVEETLAELKITQNQLIQHEKLASLGQLTAGIAHEIKNPLNFINNFSELSLELIDEVFEEIKKPDIKDASENITAILEDVKLNLQKVYKHGSRADSIVKSMLMHSRGSTGEKVPTALNTLISENVTLSFHSMRANKNPYNVSLDINLDESIGLLPLIAEDFSRVIINLCNNAFDAMREKLARSDGYIPKLSVTTSKSNNKIIIQIADNGPGIPAEIKDKILQPFFTTKKGTEGTGLGLSITHDIIEVHGGELRVDSKENEGAEFTIILPV
jgi:signal transduction histidine kinase